MPEYQELQQNSVDLNGQEICYYRKGRGQKILFIHGHRSDALRFEGLLDFFSNFGQVIAPDLPGCGNSPAYRSKNHSAANYAQTVGLFVDHLDLQELIVVGGSFGGIVTLHLFPEIRHRINKIALLVTPVKFSYFAPRFQRWRRFRALLRYLARRTPITKAGDWIIGSDRLMRLILKKSFPPEDRQEAVINYEIAQWRKMPFTVWAETALDLFNLEFDEKTLQIEKPTLIAETTANQYYDSEKNLATLKKIAPQHQVIELDWQIHVPRGEIPRSYFKDFALEIEHFIGNKRLS